MLDDQIVFCWQRQPHFACSPTIRGNRRRLSYRAKAMAGESCAESNVRVKLNPSR